MGDPQATCQYCGGKNLPWSVDSDRWNAAVESLGLMRSIILCPACFVEGHELASGMHCSWNLVPGTPFRWEEADDE